MVMKVVSIVAVEVRWLVEKVVRSVLYRYRPVYVESNNSFWDQRQRGGSESVGGSGEARCLLKYAGPARSVGYQLHNGRLEVLWPTSG
jgi:hypothetical protein